MTRMETRLDTSVAPGQAGARILMVDDDPGIRDVVSDFLGRHGYQVVTAGDFGTGPIDAVYKAVNKIVQVDNDLTEFSVQAVTRGIDALGEVTIRVTAPDGEVYTGRGADGDIVVSSTKAYLNALNRLLNDKAEHAK